MRTEFAAFIAVLAREEGTMQKIADAVGMSLSAFSRGVKQEGTLSPLNCLRLAAAFGLPGSKVLNLAGKHELSDLIERLYGAPTPGALSDAERDHLDLWRTLDVDERRPFETLLRAVAGDRVSKKVGRKKAG